MVIRYITKTRDILESRIEALTLANRATVDIDTKKEIERDLDTYHLLYRQHCGEEYRHRKR